MIAILLALTAWLGLGSPLPALAQDKPPAQEHAQTAEVVKRFVQAVHAKDLDTLFSLSASGAANVAGRYAYFGQRTREDFQLALAGDPSLCPAESNIGLNCRDRAFRGDRVVTDVRLFVPQGSKWRAVAMEEPLYDSDQALVAVKVTYPSPSPLIRVRGLQGKVGPDAPVRPPVPPYFGDGWVTPDNPLFKDIQTRIPGYKFFIQYQRQEVLSGELVLQLFKGKQGWLVENTEFVESKAVLGQPAQVDTSKK